MDFVGFLERLEATGLGEWMRTSVKATPVVESIHVVALCVVFGTILLVDLRLLGLPSTRRAFTRTSGELLRWTWAAFAIAALAGAAMFTANATSYVMSLHFRLKMLLMLAAAVNMVAFHFVTSRTVAAWDKDAPTPFAARVAGVLSILLWTGVIILGRYIGFKTPYDFEIPEGVDLEFTFI